MGATSRYNLPVMTSWASRLTALVDRRICPRPAVLVFVVGLLVTAGVQLAAACSVFNRGNFRQRVVLSLPDELAAGIDNEYM